MNKVKEEIKKKETSTLSVEKVNSFLDTLTENNAYDITGVFRISGRASDIPVVLSQVQNNEPINLPSLSPECFVHCVATALKGYLTSCEIPIFPCDRYTEAINIIGKFLHIIVHFYFHCTNNIYYFLLELENPESRVQEMAELLSHLPSVHFLVLKNIIKFLLRLSDNHEKNMMTVENCGISLYFFTLDILCTYLLMESIY